MTEPTRYMPDGTPCWCVSDDPPHAGWVHSPRCNQTFREETVAIIQDEGERLNEQLVPLKRLALNATPGPWSAKVNPNFGGITSVVVAPGEHSDKSVASLLYPNDAEFIVAAVAYVREKVGT